MLRIYFLPLFLLTAFLFGLSACEKQDIVKLKEAEVQALSQYFTSKKIVPDTIQTGLYFIHGKTGIGNSAQNGDKISVFYTGKLLDGKVFDTNVNSNPFVFTLGNGEVIKGWELGILNLREGDTGTLIMLSDLAYGGIKNGVIPAYSTLIFDIYIQKITKKVR
jgi:FKBP-type peptidyl-prolyl cis-trans isomerase